MSTNTCTHRELNHLKQTRLGFLDLCKKHYANYMKNHMWEPHIPSVTDISVNNNFWILAEHRDTPLSSPLSLWQSQVPSQRTDQDSSLSKTAWVRLQQITYAKCLASCRTHKASFINGIFYITSLIYHMSTLEASCKGISESYPALFWASWIKESRL